LIHVDIASLHPAARSAADRVGPLRSLPRQDPLELIESKTRAFSAEQQQRLAELEQTEVRRQQVQVAAPSNAKQASGTQPARNRTTFPAVQMQRALNTIVSSSLDFLHVLRTGQGAGSTQRTRQEIASTDDSSGSVPQSGDQHREGECVGRDVHSTADPNVLRRQVTAEQLWSMQCTHCSAAAALLLSKCDSTSPDVGACRLQDHASYHDWLVRFLWAHYLRCSEEQLVDILLCIPCNLYREGMLQHLAFNMIQSTVSPLCDLPPACPLIEAGASAAELTQYVLLLQERTPSFFSLGDAPKEPPNVAPATSDMTPAPSVEPDAAELAASDDPGQRYDPIQTAIMAYHTVASSSGLKTSFDLSWAELNSEYSHVTFHQHRYISVIAELVSLEQHGWGTWSGCSTVIDSLMPRETYADFVVERMLRVLVSRHFPAVHPFALHTA